MNNKDRMDAEQLARKGQAVDKITAFLVESVLANPSPGTAVQGIVFTKSGTEDLLFEARAHQVRLLARYVHHIAEGEIVGRIYFCRRQFDGGLGDPVLQLEVRANGDVDFPDGEDLDLWPQNDPNVDQVRRSVSFQLLKAMQNGLTAL